MSRWFRLDDDVINDPKILLLPEAIRWIWIAFLCIASKNDGVLPEIEIIALSLRVKVTKAAEYLTRLVVAGLIDKTETGFAPHNWAKRQFKSDVSTERVKRFRKHNRNVSETPPHTHTQTETQAEKKDSEADASGADAPIDHRKRLFDEGLRKLARLTGKGPDACRSFVGKCLKAASDDAVTVLGLIEDAERNQVVDPSGWIAARLKPTEVSNGKTGNTIIQAADALRRKVASFDGPASRDLDVRDGPTRLLLGCYRTGDANDPDTYVAAIAVTLARYSEEIITAVTHPVSGLPSKKSWLPTVKEVRDACDELDDFERRKIARERGIREQLAARRQEEIASQVRPTLEELHAKYGKNWGLGTLDERPKAPVYPSFEQVAAAYSADPSRIARLIEIADQHREAPARLLSVR